MKVLTQKGGGLDCNECGKSSEVVVQIGEEPPPFPQDEVATAWVCLACLKEAIGLVVTKTASESKTVNPLPFLPEQGK